jgi:uncharacterized protein YbjQ (UPF0145 family)
MLIATQLHNERITNSQGESMASKKKHQTPPRAVNLTTQVVTRLKASLVERVDEYARAHELDRSKAVRELVERGLVRS